MADYLDRKIDEMKRTEQPAYGLRAWPGNRMTGFPTSWKIRLEGENRWRRLMVWQFSNNGTLFIRIKGKPFVVKECDLPSRDGE